MRTFIAHFIRCVRISIRLLLVAGIVSAVVALGYHYGWRLELVIPVACAVLFPAFRLAAPNSFKRLISFPLWRWRARRAYRRSWADIAQSCGLSRTRQQITQVPGLFDLRVGGNTDRIGVVMVAGQCLADFERAADRLATAYAAQRCRITESSPGTLTLALTYVDPLSDIIGPLPMTNQPDLRRVPIGLVEDGQLWQLPVLGIHCFVAGATGSGKGSVIWSALRALAPSILEGTTRVWAIDPKGGMELGFGRPLFSRFAADATEQMVTLLEDAVAVMDERCARLAGHVRQHNPTFEEPMIVVHVDELASLTAYEPDRRLRERASSALSALLTKGRAAAIVVIAAAQDPRKEVVGFRSLFPTKIALRLDTGVQVDMVLGEGMYMAGARCDRIGAGQAGVGYVTVDGVRGPIRVRASWIDDDTILELGRSYPAPPDMPPAVEIPIWDEVA